jgi:hypothetical protein
MASPVPSLLAALETDREDVASWCALADYLEEREHLRLAALCRWRAVNTHILSGGIEPEGYDPVGPPLPEHGWWWVVNVDDDGRIPCEIMERLTVPIVDRPPMSEAGFGRITKTMWTCLHEFEADLIQAWLRWCDDIGLEGVILRIRDHQTNAS